MKPPKSRRPAEALFLPGSAGALFVLYHPPADGVAHGGDVLVVPPFAEEMNKSRRMFTLLATCLSKLGVGTAIVDLFGTGDSEGDFADARYERWVEDVVAVQRWLSARSAAPVGLVGLRFGSLLATDCVARGAFPVDRLVLWQPIVSGELMITQFLRLRVAAAMTADVQAKESTTVLRQRLAAGEALEIAGYTLAPELAKTLEGLRLEPLVSDGFPPVSWLEIGSGALSPASRRVLDGWRGRGVQVGADAVAGPPFWSSVEIAVAPALIDHTVRILDRRAAI